MMTAWEKPTLTCAAPRFSRAPARYRAPPPSLHSIFPPPLWNKIASQVLLLLGSGVGSLRFTAFSTGASLFQGALVGFG
ncbi:hypothetical protein OPV22_025679 [Ensete ventricosum]|uniref:Uncharacterized protein n=1 Tax=Ensete ventricosum TaxID=4639 RepID=A0AAV8Q819_ENSVE|nr:hypothetical protein OPV22_025679 [Ensete ventricosum]